MMCRYIFKLLFAAIFFVSSVHAQTPTMSRRQAAGRSMEQQGLVNIKHVVPSIKVALMYARTDNFCNRQSISMCLILRTEEVCITMEWL